MDIELQAIVDKRIVSDKGPLIKLMNKLTVLQS